MKFINNRTVTHLYCDKGFTLAEVLIALVVIGVIAAITIPMIKNNFDDKKWNTARLKANSTIGEAFRQMTINMEITTSLTTDSFVKQIIPKYIKIVKSCSSAEECGFPTKIKKPDNSEMTIPTKWTDITNTFGILSPIVPPRVLASSEKQNPTTRQYDNSYFFETLDGFHVNFFYNPYCAVNSQDKIYLIDSGTQHRGQLVFDTICFNGIYDMNGTKGPNQVGKDIGFVGSIYNSVETKSSAVFPFREEKYSLKWQDAFNYCNNLDNGKWTLPNINEIAILYANRKLFSNNTDDFWVSTVYNNGTYYTKNVFKISFNNGYLRPGPIYNSLNTRCVRSTKNN